MAVLDDLLDRVRTALPDLTFTRVRLDEAGGDHRVLVIDEDMAFRFPRDADVSARLAVEIATLEALRRHFARHCLDVDGRIGSPKGQ
ncbi:MAG: hypothetical protein WDN44_03645 [Sphingomonas sp.]